MKTDTGSHWSKSLAIALGARPAVLGLLVIVGWHTHNEGLIHVRPNFVAMVYNTALGFVFCGTGIVAITKAGA